MRHWWLLVIATALSSGLGLRGNLSIWGESLAGDLVFVATTVGAFLLTRRLATGNLVLAMLVAFPLHWLAYGLSWAVTTQEAPDAELFESVLQIGWMGLAWCVLAVPLLRVAEQGLQALDPALRQPL